MSEEKNVIKGNSFFVSRDLFNHWIGSRATWTAMWVKLLGLAKWKDNSKLKAGQAEININDLSFLGVSTKQIRDFLKRLIESGEVTTESRTGNRYVKSTMIITILKWDEYQVVPEKDVTSRASLGHLKGISKPVTTAKSLENRDTKKEEGIKNKKNIVPSGHQQVMDHIWKTYEAKYGYKPPGVVDRNGKESHGAIGKLLKEALKIYSPAMVMAAWDDYLADNGDCYKGHAPLTFFKATVLPRFLTQEQKTAEQRQQEESERVKRDAEIRRGNADRLGKLFTADRPTTGGDEDSEGR